MRSILLRSVVALLTFAIGVAVASAWLYSYRSHKIKEAAPPLSQEISTQPTPPNPAEIPIDLADFYGYIREPSLTCKDYDSSLSANKALWKMVKSDDDPFTKIVKRGAKINGRGQRVGRRVITWYCCGVEGQSAAHIYWTDGSKFCDIIAASVKEALDFERKNNP